MAIATLLWHEWLSPLQALVDWLAARPRRPAAHPAQRHPAWHTPPPRKPKPPVRVVRVVDAGQAPAAAGRMVISGRMADVCAELDRLAAQEAARR